MGIRIVIPDARISMDPLKAYTYSYLPLASNMKPIINKYKAELDSICTITNKFKISGANCKCAGHTGQPVHRTDNNTNLIACWWITINIYLFCASAIR